MKSCSAFSYARRALLLLMLANHSTRVSMKGLEKFVDLDAFRKRVEEVAASGTAPEVVEFLEAWRRADKGQRD